MVVGRRRRFISFFHSILFGSFLLWVGVCVRVFNICIINRSILNIFSCVLSGDVLEIPSSVGGGGWVGWGRRGGRRRKMMAFCICRAVT